MSDDRSPVDGWFREEPGQPPMADGPHQPQQQPEPQRPQPQPQPQGFGPGGALWDDGRGDGPGSPDDAPTQVAGFPAIRQEQGPPATYGRADLPQPDQGSVAGYGGADYQQQQWQGQGAFPGQGRGQEPFPAWPQGQGQGAFPQQARQGQEWGQQEAPVQAQAAFMPQGQQQVSDPAYSYPEYQPHPHDRRGGGRSARVPLIAGGAVAGVAALALIAYMALGSGGGSPKTGNAARAAAASPSPTHTSFQPTSTDPATAAAQTGAAFLTAWQSGDLRKAAKYTDDPTSALAALTSYKSWLSLSALTLTPHAADSVGASPTAGSTGTGGASNTSSAPSSASGSSGSAAPSGTVPFDVAATVSQHGKSATLPWSYSSSLMAYKQSDGWSVHWASSILAPKLAPGQQLAVVSVPPGAGKVVDARGTKLSSYSESALKNINSALQQKAPSGQGSTGVAVEITTGSGKAVAGTSTTLKKPVDASVVKTTISPTAEALARSAVAMHARSSMVVLRPSTGAILAVANSSGTGDTALTGGLAPGSTFKIVTTAALLNNGYVSLYTPIACPLTYTVQGVVYHNSTDSEGKNEESLPAGTPFITDFAQSCNNAFTPFYKQLEGGKLAHTASTYFGLDRSWDIGLGPNSYFSMPGDSSGAELAQENFGQGKVVGSPLAMASVAATVGTGSFHQPYLVDGVTKITATALPSGTDSNLKTLMRAVVTGGTAAGVFHGVGAVYAKTGTAEADANKDGKPNAWMVVYSPSMDVAIGVVVQDSGFGATYAGPEAQYVLSHL
jgi:hypothetical protein